MGNRFHSRVREPIPHNLLNGGPGCSSPADFNLGSTAHSKVLNFSSVHALTPGASLRTIRSDKNKPTGTKNHRVYDEFGLSVDIWVLLKHCCRTLSCSVRVWSPKCKLLTWFTGLELYLVSNSISCRILLWFIYWSYQHVSWFTLPQKTLACIWMLLRYQLLLISHRFFSIFSLLIYFFRPTTLLQCQHLPF